MPTLNGNKPTLLSQLRKQPNIELQKLVQLLQTYEDLSVNDLEGVVPQLVFEQLREAGRKPEEIALWNEIESSPRNNPAEIQDLQRKVTTYLQRYPDGPKAADAQNLTNQLQQELADAMQKQREAEAAAREQSDWATLERGNYTALRNYKMKYPSSVHMDELDDLMWENTKNAISIHSLNRYLTDWPLGRHAAEANKAIASFGEWDSVKRSGDLFLVDDYRDNNPDSPFINDVNALYYQLRDEELAKMKSNPSEYSKDDVERLLAADIFTRWELEDEELITEESWEKLQLDRDLFPVIQDYQIEDPNITAPAGCTDIYLFGTPGTGKTCLLMGLAGANGQGYTLNMKTHGGPYASALQEYVNAGITPGRTFGKFVTTINGQVSEQMKGDKFVQHHINLVEMSGEEFALRIADSREVSLSDMGTGATNLLMNENRKVFFIIVDSTKDKVKVEYVEQVKDNEGNVIDERIRKKYISQLSILNKFVSLFELPENQSVMQRVDAIHFIVTKADMLGEENVRLEKARELLINKYSGPVEQLKTYCRQTKRINASTNYRPQVFTFSLGRFFLGDVFDFNDTETRKIIDTIRFVTAGKKEKTWWDRFKESIS